MDLQNQNGAAVKTETSKQVSNAQSNVAKKETAPVTKPSEPQPPSTAVEKVKAELTAQPVESPITDKGQQQTISELSLDARLKLVNDLHRRSVQRVNLMSRMRQLEAFEIALVQGNDELEENPYQGCKLIIRDDQNRDFVTTTPGLIRMVAQYIFMACDQKLQEIESKIIFPGA